MNLQKVPSSVASVVVRTRIVLAAVLLCCTWSSSALAETPDRDFFVDARGRKVRFSSVYDGWFGGQRYQPNYGRAAVENVAVFALELAVYWSDPGSNIVDWQYPDVAAKLTSNEAVRLDDNLLQTNYLFHSFAGGTHFLIMRANGFGVLPSFLTASASSALYEFVLEWKEIVSINDLIVTPFGGAAMGEFFHQLGNYLNSAPIDRSGPIPAALRGSSRTTFGLPRRLHDALDEPPPPPSVPLDNLGLSSAYDHHFRVFAIQDTNEHEGQGTSSMYGADARFEISAMPGFLRTGTFDTAFSEGNFTDSAVRISLGDGTKDASVRFDSHLFGWYSQDIRAAPGGHRGYGSETALGVSMRYVTRTLHGQEQFGIVHLAQPIQRAWFALGPVRLKLSTAVSPDFASVRAIAYEPYRDEYGSGGSKSSLLRHGYVHALGFSAENSVALGVQGIEAGIEGRYGIYESLDGIERLQEQVTRDTHSREVLTELGAYVRIDPPKSAFTTMIEFSSLRHDSRLDSVSATQVMRRLTVGVGLHF